ncbi:hypothetical protein PHYSODRAFT_299031 [Phytophthora sojae]|uniref:Uncharacterized protein n=1 Tax=Phytophthora sojae (strain P6497) TaxID=1094619 RepID=G4ZA54_PHYSP|nr:hypothetical protein PHYSODRAFT_299031 [Phytophthora sojae]EGZ21193.1 hypothetical protein PHYSODRAFT_299031 [Phytophthora sojae]|eukprot:XP_009523910.1 hypothetical protein PHYSODRAFT_299031 [Phytophthora sojae]
MALIGGKCSDLDNNFYEAAALTDVSASGARRFSALDAISGVEGGTTDASRAADNNTTCPLQPNSYSAAARGILSWQVIAPQAAWGIWLRAGGHEHARQQRHTSRWRQQRATTR